jgi:hypothetical protein
MDFTVYSPARAWLYRRRHPLWFSVCEPLVSIIAVGLMLAGLFVLEAVAVGLALLVGLVLVLSFIY